MCKKICCKNCEYLNFYDTYFCSAKNVQDIEIKKILIKDNIEKHKCELYTERKRKEKFWINGEW